MDPVSETPIADLEERVYLFDREGRCLCANYNALAFHRIKPQEIAGKLPSELGFPWPASSVGHISQADNGGEIIAFTQEGRSYEGLLSPLVGEDGKVKFIVLTVREQTGLSSRNKRTGQLFSLQVMEAQERERKRIARELHDEIGQMISIIKVNLQRYRRSTDELAKEKLLESSIENLGQILSHVRRLSHDLRPAILDDLGLVAALKWYLEHRLKETGITFHFLAEKVRRLPTDMETACFRAVQEAITNIIHHAEAEEITVKLQESNGQLNLSIQDNGKGFDLTAIREEVLRCGHLGLIGMRERIRAVGGTMTIESAVGKG